MVAEDSISPATQSCTKKPALADLLSDYWDGWGHIKNLEKKETVFWNGLELFSFPFFLNEKIVIAVTNSNQIGYPTSKYFVPLTYFLCHFQITQVTFVAKHF